MQGVQFSTRIITSLPVSNVNTDDEAQSRVLLLINLSEAHT